MHLVWLLLLLLLTNIPFISVFNNIFTESFIFLLFNCSAPDPSLEKFIKLKANGGKQCSSHCLSLLCVPFKATIDPFPLWKGRGKGRKGSHRNQGKSLWVHLCPRAPSWQCQILGDVPVHDLIQNKTLRTWKSASTCELLSWDQVDGPIYDIMSIYKIQLLGAAENRFCAITHAIQFLFS